MRCRPGQAEARPGVGAGGWGLGGLALRRRGREAVWLLRQPALDPRRPAGDAIEALAVAAEQGLDVGGWRWGAPKPRVGAQTPLSSPTSVLPPAESASSTTHHLSGQRGLA